MSRPLTTELKAVDKAFEEMQLLDAILQKAKKVRTSPKQKMKRAAHAHQTETVRGGSLTSKCSEQAARVYKQPVSRAVRLAVRKSSSTSSSQRRRKKTAMTVTAEHFTGSDRCHKTAMPPAEGEDGAHRKDGANFNHDDYESGKNLSLEMAAFNVQQQGCVVY